MAEYDRRPWASIGFAYKKFTSIFKESDPLVNSDVMTYI